MSRVADSKVAKRYASALFAAARKLGKNDSIEDDLSALNQLWRQVPALRQTLESPLVPGERKHSLIDKALAKEIDPLSCSFLHLLVDKRREDLLPAVGEEYLRQADELKGLLRAHATVAAPLDHTQQTSLVAGLASRTGKLIELTVEVDPSVIGGVVVRMLDTVIDGSVRGALDRLQEQMLLER